MGWHGNHPISYNQDGFIIEEKYLSNCITDNVKTCNNNRLIMVLGLYQLFMVFVMIFLLFLSFLLIFMNMQSR